MRVLRFESYRETPWKNGGGLTHEIARSDDAGEPAWRVSVATIDRDGPFSDFTGFDRTIVPVEGMGFELTFDDGERIVLDRWDEPYRFEGERKVHCRLLAGRSRDLNAIALRTKWEHEVRAFAIGERIAVDAFAHSFLYFGGEALAAHEDQEIAMRAGDTLAFDEPARIAVGAEIDTYVLLVRFTPRA
jgi:uncharacterized protein